MGRTKHLGSPDSLTDVHQLPVYQSTIAVAECARRIVYIIYNVSKALKTQFHRNDLIFHICQILLFLLGESLRSKLREGRYLQSIWMHFPRFS